MGRPRWLTVTSQARCSLIVPPPDAAICLDDFIDAVYAHNKQVASDQLGAAPECHLRVVASASSAAIINRSPPLSKVIAYKEARILLELERWKLRRLGLESAR